MKTLAILAVSFISFGTFAQTAEKKEKAKKETKTEVKSPVAFKTLKIERAEIKYDSKEPFVFEFKNNGKTPLIITNVQTSCGCTAAEKPTEPIAKGKSSKIVVNYDTKRVGQFTKTITVTTNASAEPIILTITGKVLPEEVAPTTN
ncbi:DUF1573 domain-containing protein [Fluviicola taffensis]|uniref:DUF1573 domain-containing protein n=1 Tax=Fluviicola taffensis (strain DSM 16823 / NCIMB 13979 / RW262) TaxID=755732 RepID=F2IFG5_FLUTR|nr:DUF1573 domain-containing protein [Fluviicola taffensis]AEA44650.1 protein of unknown function DUF1573 [Fluviicola taffensis DSM 16823]